MLITPSQVGGALELLAPPPCEGGGWEGVSLHKNIVVHHQRGMV